MPASMLLVDLVVTLPLPEMVKSIVQDACFVPRKLQVWVSVITAELIFDVLVATYESGPSVTVKSWMGLFSKGFYSSIHNVRQPTGVSGPHVNLGPSMPLVHRTPYVVSP